MIRCILGAARAHSDPAGALPKHVSKQPPQQAWTPRHCLHRHSTRYRAHSLPRSAAEILCVKEPELEFLSNLWGLGTKYEKGYRTGPPGYIVWRNCFIGIDSWSP